MTFETIIATRLGYLAEQFYLLHKWQIGSRPKRSAVDACMMIIRKVDNTKHKNKTVSSLCMDVKGACDNAYLERLLNTIKEKNLLT